MKTGGKNAMATTRVRAPSIGCVRPYDWYLLVKDALEFMERTGMKLSLVWSYIHKEDFEQARARMDDLLVWETKGEAGRARRAGFVRGNE